MSIESPSGPSTAQVTFDLEALVELRPLPAIASQVLAICSNGDGDVMKLTKLIECDGALSTRLLSMVNSSSFGYSREVNSIKQAVVILGARQLSQLAVTIATQTVFSQGGEGSADRLRLYEHSLATATLSRILAQRASEFQLPTEVESSDAFLAGVLHDVGKLIICDVEPAFFSNMVATGSEANTLQVEREKFGIDHAQIGTEFGSYWMLPTSVGDAISNHHQPPDPHPSALIQILKLSNQLVRVWGIGQPIEDLKCGFTSDWLNEVAPESISDLEQDATEQYRELKSVILG